MKSAARPILALEDHSKLAGRSFCNDGSKALTKMCERSTTLEHIKNYIEKNMKEAAEKCQNETLFLMHENGLGGEEVRDTVLRCAYFFKDKTLDTITYAIGRGDSGNDAMMYEPRYGAYWVPCSSQPGFMR